MFRIRSKRLLGSAFALALAACTAVQVSYNHVGSLVRYLVWEYVDLDTRQSEAMQQRVARLHDWHRSQELPEYVQFLQSVHSRLARGIDRRDVDWGIASLRLHYRRFAVRASEEAAPILVTLSAEQIGSIEGKFAKEEAKYVKEWLSGSEAKRERRATERMIERFEDWTGDLRPEQQARIREFVRAHPRSAQWRLEDRRRWQKKALELVREYRAPDELAARLGRLFGEPEHERAAEIVSEMRRWEEDLTQLIVDIAPTLSAEQRARVLRRIDRYTEDFKSLGARGVRSAEALSSAPAAS